MTNIPLKINPPQKPRQRDINNALNLNAPKITVPRPGKAWPFLAFCFLTAALTLAGFLFLEKKQPKWPYTQLIPENYRITAFISLNQLKSLTMPYLSEIEKNSGFFAWTKERVLNFAAEKEINSAQLLALFEDKALIAALPQPGAQGNNWLFLVKTKPGQPTARQNAINEIESGLKKDFSLNEFIYRQLRIKSVHSLVNPENSYFYALAKDFVVISNNQNALQEILNKIIEG